ncbi:hypothetical protein [Bradyrhizobium sp. SZCCHNRI1073]|uniref:hypothetical protein n=1 Tax=Bradyrhizobium sp. SZCCHNRI1073 TaxID=3057280 RepID=UPI002916D268|nr:hypothetical protein [Bradyrhizobium sp. SZCCHNRI1073]
MSDYSKLPPIAVSLGGFAFNGEHIEYWKTQATKADREIASLRAQIAEANSKLAALNLCEPHFLDRKLRELDQVKAQLASARKAAIEECCATLEARADLLTNSLHCGDNASTIATAHRESRALYQAAVIINELALTDEKGKP